MRLLKKLSNALKSTLKALNPITPRDKPRSPSLQKALDAYYRANRESRRDLTMDNTDIKRLISYPLETPLMDPDTIWYRREQGQTPNTQPMCMDDMWPCHIKELFVMLPVMLNHIPYKVCGLSALVAYGYTSRMPAFLTIACPEESLQTILAWAAAAGMPTHPEHPNSFGIQLQDGTIRKVHVEAMSEFAFHATDSTFYSPFNVPIVTLASLADAMAEIYVRKDVNAPQRAVLQDDIFWLLRRIIADDSGVHMLRRETCPHVWHARFWTRFNTERPDARGLFNEATYVPDYRLPTPQQSSWGSLNDLLPPSQPAQTLRRVGHRRYR